MHCYWEPMLKTRTHLELRWEWITILGTRLGPLDGDLVLLQQVAVGLLAQLLAAGVLPFVVLLGIDLHPGECVGGSTG
jgi:hypothetical protein